MVFHCSLVNKIQKRLVRVLVSCLEKAKYDRKCFAPPPPKPSTQDYFDNSRHNLLCENSSVRCADCCSSVSCHSPNFINWLKSPCLALPFDDSQFPASVPTWYCIQIANTIPHSSHVLFSMRGIIFCNACGAYGAKKCKLLAGICNTVCSVASQRAKDRLMQGLLPTKLMRWPRDACFVFQPSANLSESSSACAPSANSRHTSACLNVPTATDTPCHISDQTGAARSSVNGGEPCLRKQSTSHFDDPEDDYVIDESFFQS